MVKQEERRDRARTTLLEVARVRFGEQGFADTTIDQIATDAGSAKGALYHYFSTKRALFEAVLEEVSGEVAEQTQGGLLGEDLIDAMMAALRTFFSLCAEPRTSRILLEDGPSVLGWARWREIDAQHFGGAVKTVLMAAMEQGVLQAQPVEPLARLLLGGISEAVIDCAGQSDFEEHAEAYIASLQTLLDGLRA